MSKAQLTKLFGARLKEHPAFDGVLRLDEPQPLCGGNFEVLFFFDPQKPKAGLVGESLELEGSGNANGHVGDCLLRQFTAKYGKPVLPRPPSGEYYFAGDRVVLIIATTRVSIIYRGRGPFIGI